MRRALLAISLVLAALAASEARADIPPGPPPWESTPSPQATQHEREREAFERGRAVGRVVGFGCAFLCCVVVPGAGSVIAIVVSIRKQKAKLRG